MPTGWRPADVAERYPVAIIDNPEDQKKYDPKSSTDLKVWAAIQMVLSVVSAMFLFNHLVAINEAGLHLGITILQPTLLYGLLYFSPASSLIQALWIAGYQALFGKHFD